jgi:hypothetical protein
MTTLRSVHAAVLLAVTICAGSEALLAQAPAAACSSVAYRGFDSRLEVEALGRVATQGERVTGFEVSNGRPVVSFERRLVALDGERQLALPSIDAIDAIAVDAEGELWIQQGTRLRRVAKDKLETVRAVAASTRIHNSGHALFLESESRGEATRLTIRTADDRGALPPFHIQGGKAATVSWNPVGVAAVVADSLLTWTAGSKNVNALRNDRGFRAANDVTLIAPNRAVIALPNTLALVTDRGATVLALIRARVRWSNGALYVFDENWGVIWKIAALDRIGAAGADNAHAATLLRALPPAALESHVNFLEAARLVGCEGARALRKKR